MVNKLITDMVSQILTHSKFPDPAEHLANIEVVSDFSLNFPVLKSVLLFITLSLPPKTYYF